MKKFLKILLIVILVIIVVPLVVALFVKKEYSVEREVTINRPVQEVFDYLVLLENQDNFSVWMEMDPNVRKTSKGVDGTVGYVSSWQSDDKNVGSGAQEIAGITPGKRIDYELRFLEPFESTSFAYITTDAVSDNQTNVKWAFDGKMNYPMNLMLLLMDMESMIGNDLEVGLLNLKQILETYSRP